MILDSRRTIVVAAAMLSATACANGGGRWSAAVTEWQRTAPPPEQAQGDGEALFAGAATLERGPLIAAVLARNPSLEAAREAWREALARAQRTAPLDDPMLSWMVAPLSVAGDAPFGQRIQLEQRFPWPGMRRLEGRMALAEAEATAQQYALMRLELALAAWQLHADSFAVARALEVNARHAELVSEARGVAEAQLAVGRAHQQDVLQAEAELVRLERERLALEAQRDVLAAQLNGLLHRRADAPLPPPPPALPPPEAAEPDAAALERRALATRPELRAARARLEAGEAAVDLAGLERFPMFGVMAEYDSMAPHSEHQWMIGVSVSLPLGRGWRRAGVEQARAGVRREQRELTALEDAIRVEVRTAARRVREAREALALLKTRLLPVAVDRLASAQAGFIAGKLPFSTLIEAERQLRDVELELVLARAELERRRGELERAVGAIAGEAGETDEKGGER